jgi:hypothetical protein
VNVLLSIAKAVAASKYGPAILKVLGQRVADLAVRRLGKQALSAADALQKLLAQRDQIVARLNFFRDHFGAVLPPRVLEVVEMLEKQLDELDALLAAGRAKLEPKA